MTIVDYLQNMTIWDALIVAVGILYPAIFDVIERVLQFAGLKLEDPTVTRIAVFVAAVPVSGVAVWLIIQVAPEYQGAGLEDVWHVLQALVIAFLGTLTFSSFKARGMLHASRPVRTLKARYEGWRDKAAA